MDPQDSSIAELTPKEAVAALERFVIDNDELLELEEQIGRFNIFDALGVVRQEIRHSNFLAWLLEPAESHGQGQLFLKAILMDLLRQTPLDDRPLSPIDLDGVDLAGVEVRREWENIDILIVANDPAVVIAIENKIDAGEHSNQLKRYMDTVLRDYPKPKYKHLFVFLTPEGDEPSEDDWTTYNYGDIHNALERCLRLNEDSIGNEVATFLRHYLNVIRGRLMDDPKIDEMCERIYRNHRHAVEMLVERMGDPRSRIIREIREKLEADAQKWYVEGDHNISCRFLPKKWFSILPAINSRPQLHPNAWVFATIRLLPRKIIFDVIVGPTSDEKIRGRLVEAIHTDTGKKHGFRPYSNVRGKNWAKVYRHNLLSDKNGIDYSEDIVESILEHLPEIESRLNKMGDFMEQTLSK